MTEEQPEKVRCSFCKKPVKQGEFHALIRGFNAFAQNDRTINLSDHQYDSDNFNIKYEKIICKECVKAGKWKKLGFN